MKTKIVYALVSNDSDIYLEQTLVSLMSLRHNSPGATAVLVIDRQTDATLVDFRATILDYIDEKIVVDTPDGYTKVQRSRYLKTGLRRFVAGPFLFVDGDTAIAEPLDEIDTLIERGTSIAAVSDLHLARGEYFATGGAYIQQKTAACGYTDFEGDPYYNSGVLFVGDTETAHRFYDMWQHEWSEQIKKGSHFDQPSFAKTNHKLGYIVEELDGQWNCQVNLGGLRFLSDSKIIHYFATLDITFYGKKQYILSERTVYTELKQTETISDDLKQWIARPRAAIADTAQLIDMTFWSKLISTGMFHLYIYDNRYFKRAQYIAYNFWRLYRDFKTNVKKYRNAKKTT